MGKRNLQGGNKTKAMAKSTTPYEKTATRTPQSQEEKYAIVKSVSGSGRFRLLSADKKLYVGILPGSMRGHKKRNYYVGLDTIVLINDRSSWQTIKDNSHADIVHVYTPHEINRLDLFSFFLEPGKLHDNPAFLFQTCATDSSNLLPTTPLPFSHTQDHDDVNLDFI